MDPQAEALAQKATAFFKGGLFERAADLYMQAFALSQLPLMVYNAARAYEEAGKLREAKALFAHFLRLPGGAPDVRTEAARRRMALDSAIEAPGALPVKPAPTQPEPPRAKAAPGRTPARPAPAAPQPTVEVPAPSPPFPVWQAVSAGVAGAAAVGCYLVAAQRVAEARALFVTTEADKQAYLALADESASWQAAAIGLGVAAGALAVWTVVELARRPGSGKAARGGAARTSRCAPTVHEGGAGVAWTAGF